jgi:hypothetical protein
MTIRTIASLCTLSADRLLAVAAAVGLLALAASAGTAQVEVYHARLTPVPLIGGGAPTGTGSATATLNGTTLEVTGSFAQLARSAGGRGRGGGEPEPSPATAVRLHAGPLTAVRGEPFSDLMLEPASEGEAPGPSGSISGSVDLTADQVELLREGRVYAQIYSEAAPEGHLFGWFLQ